MERIIFHIDVNSAFLSWEAARRVKDGLPDIRLIPAIIGGDPKTRSGIVLAKSIPSKQYGIVTGEPVGLALRKCPTLEVYPPDFKLYTLCSRAFMDICRAYAPVVEQFSIDECFMDMTGTRLIYPDIIKTAYEIKDKIHNELGFTVNIGIGPNKLLAKTASDFEKPDKVHTLFFDELPSKYYPLPVGDVVGIGPATAEKLISHGIKTVGDLKNIDESFLRKLFGNKMAENLKNYGCGYDDSPVSDTVAEAKGYSISSTFEENITGYRSAESAILALCDSVCARMRYDEKKAYTVSVTVRDLKFKNSSHQRKMQNPTDVTSEIYNVCKSLLRELWDGKTPLRLLGVALFDLTSDEVSQISLFSDNTMHEKERKVDTAVDRIRGKYGSESINRAGSRENDRIGKKYKAVMDNDQK